MKSNYFLSQNIYTITFSPEDTQTNGIAVEILNSIENKKIDGVIVGKSDHKN